MNLKVYTTPSAVLPCSLLTSLYDANPTLVEWAAVHSLITTDPGIKQNTLNARGLLAQGNAAAYARQKSLCGAITPAAQCNGGRKAANVVALTGVAMVDLDHVPADRLPEIEAAIKADAHTFLYHRTASGAGCRIFFRYTSSAPQVAYFNAWRYGNEYYSLLTQCEHDQATKDVTRLSYLSHDADAFFNPDATPFAIASAQSGADPSDRLTADYSADDRIRWAEALLDKQNVYYAEGNRHHYLMQLLILLVKYGIPVDTAEAHIAALAPRGAKEAHDLTQWVYDHHAESFGTWLETQAKTATKSRQKESPAENSPTCKSKAANVEEIRDYIVSSQRLRYNVTTGNLEIFSEEQHQFVDMDDRVSNSLWHDCNIALKKYVRHPDFDKELHSEAVSAFDPIRHYFDHLPEWDGQDHIAALASRVHTTTQETLPVVQADGSDAMEPLFTFCFRKWFVAMVASWLNPKVLNEAILTFIGAQGIYKSTFFRRLLPPELERYFLAKSNSSYLSKDDKIAVSSYALIDFEEIDSLKDSDLNAVKALVTTEQIAERAAYARNRENRPHLASFCATGNNQKFLTDLTGNRRWLPFQVLSIDSPYDNPIPYDQLYAQARHLAQPGHFQYWFSYDENEYLEAHKANFAEPCLEEELVNKYFREPDRLEVGQFYSTTEIIARCSVDLRGQLQPRRMGQVLTRMGFKQRRTGTKRGYILVERTYEEIQVARVNTASQIIKQEQAPAGGKQGLQTSIPGVSQ